MRKLVGYFFSVLFIFLIMPAFVSANWPSTHLTENAEAFFYPNGSLITNISGTGYVEVDVGNIQDALQYIRINLSGTGNTNLVSPTCFRSTAISETYGDRTRIFVNTTTNSADFTYSITNQSVLTIIYLSLNYTNSLGGIDLVSDSENTINFNLSMNSTKDIADVDFYIRAAVNTLGLNDSIILTDISSSKGSAVLSDSDSDGQSDTIYWNGNLNKWEPVHITFVGITQGNQNFDYNNLYVDIGAGRETSLTKSFDGSVFTGIGFSDRFSRGDVRQGVEMLMTDPVVVRGFLRNMASFLNYTIHSWAIYRIDDLNNPILNSTGDKTIAPGQTSYTNWYNKTTPGKDFYTVAFDWEVEWNESATTFNSSTKSILDLPNLYVMDINPYNDIITIISNTVSGREVSIQESFKHIGHASLESNNITAVLVPPSGFSVSTSSVRVFYSNESIGGERYDITGHASITLNGSNVTVSIFNLTNATGKTLGKNEDIIITHDESGPTSTITLPYNFTTYFTAHTLSGTPATKIFEKGTYIPGVVPVTPQPPGGGGPGIIVRYADLSKESAEIRLIDNNTAEIKTVVGVYDTGTAGIRNITGMIFIPDNSEFVPTSIRLRVYDSDKGKWVDLIKDVDYILNDEGVRALVDRMYRTYSITRKEGRFDYYNNDLIELTYRVRLPFGTHELLTRFSGYDSYRRRYVSEDIYLQIRVYERVILDKLNITEGNFEQIRAYVGRSVGWTKKISVYNPSLSIREKTFEIEIFNDTLNAYLRKGSNKTRLDMRKNGISYVTWSDSFRPQEKKTYYIEVRTPPVLAVEDNMDVIGFEGDIALFMLNTTLHNMGEEDYTKIFFNLSIDPEKIISVDDENGHLNYTDTGTGDIYINIPFIGKGSEKKITVVYSETPPVIVIKPDKKNYASTDSFVNLTTIIIPSELMHSMNLEIEVISKTPVMTTVYINLISLGTLTPGKVTRVYDHFRLPSSPPGEYIVRARLRKDFWEVLQDTEVFNVFGAEPAVYRIEIAGILIAAAAFILLLVIRRYRRVSFMDDLRTMRRRIRHLRKGEKKTQRVTPKGTSVNYINSHLDDFINKDVILIGNISFLKRIMKTGHFWYSFSDGTADIVAVSKSIGTYNGRGTLRGTVKKTGTGQAYIDIIIFER